MPISVTGEPFLARATADTPCPLGSWPARLAAAIRRWRAARQAARELEQLDDRTLSDMGVSRCEIPRLVLPPGPVWK